MAKIHDLNDGSPDGKLFGLDFEPNVVVEIPEDAAPGNRDTQGIAVEKVTEKV